MSIGRGVRAGRGFPMTGLFVPLAIAVAVVATPSGMSMMMWAQRRRMTRNRVTAEGGEAIAQASTLPVSEGTIGKLGELLLGMGFFAGAYAALSQLFDG